MNKKNHIAIQMEPKPVSHTIIPMGTNWMQTTKPTLKRQKTFITNTLPTESLKIQVPRRADVTNNDLTDYNVSGLQTLDLNAPEWKIEEGNTKPEVIPRGLLLQHGVGRKSTRRGRKGDRSASRKGKSRKGMSRRARL